MNNKKTKRIIKALAALTVTTGVIIAMTGQVNAADVASTSAQVDSSNSLLMLTAVMAVCAISVGAAMGAVGGIILGRKPHE